MRYGKYMRIRSGQNQLAGNPIIKIKAMEQEIEQRIWEFIDGYCSGEEKEIILRQLAENPVWRNKYNELLTVHEMLQKQELDMPSLRFTKNVMEEIAQYQVAPATKNYINKNVIRGISAFFLLMIAGLFIYFIGQIHWTSSTSNSLLPASLDANNLNWGKLLNNSYTNMFLGISAILGLILVDKYMQAKKNTGRTEH
jgi:hypothetical protein